jgi:hypothetical protein
MLKTIVRTTACLAVSAAALIAVTKIDARASARSRSAAPADEETRQAAPPTSPSTSTPRKPKQPPPKLELASMKLPASSAATAPTALPSTARADADSELTVPDWKGKRLSVVRREARKLGFTVTAFDEEGERVPAGVGSGYRVRRQLTAAGTPIQPGADVELRVREVLDTASGY